MDWNVGRVCCQHSSTTEEEGLAGRELWGISSHWDARRSLSAMMRRNCPFLIKKNYVLFPLKKQLRAIESVGSLMTKVPAWQCDASSLCFTAPLLRALPSEGSLTGACLGGPPPSSQTLECSVRWLPSLWYNGSDCLQQRRVARLRSSTTWEQKWWQSWVQRRSTAWGKLRRKLRQACGRGPMPWCFWRVYVQGGKQGGPSHSQSFCNSAECETPKELYFYES